MRVHFAHCALIKYMVDNIKAGLDMKHFSEEERSQLARISWDMDENVAVKSLKLLTQLLYRYYGKKPIILLDEYDTPMQEAYFHGYWDRMAAFMSINMKLHLDLHRKRYLLRSIMWSWGNIKNR